MLELGGEKETERFRRYSLAEDIPRDLLHPLTTSVCILFPILVNFLISLNNLCFCCSLAERAILYELANQSSVQADKLTFDPTTPFKEMENNRAQMRGLVLLYHSLTLSH